MPTAGFEPVIPASERQQTHALDRAAAGIGSKRLEKVVSMSAGPVEYRVLQRERTL
jgi:hypothetical protein